MIPEEAVASKLTGLADAQFYVEISALTETHYTGVSQVAASLCEAALRDASPVRFMIGRRLVPAAAIEALVKIRDGSMLNWYFARERGPLAPLREHFGRAVGIYPNRKFTNRVFDREVQIVHDLSTVLLAHQHARETVLFHNAAYRNDVTTNDLTLCPSEATAADVRAYVPDVDPDRVGVVRLGHDLDAVSRRLLAEAAAVAQQSERYVMVLGTLEPRKNVLSLLQALARTPALLTAARFVFVGRVGWGTPMAQTIADLGLDEALRNGRIVLTGFIPEPVKNLLLRHAAAMVYPSIFEGFGLPVVEALAAGVPVVATRSSSIPEAGGDAPFYFDPFIAGDLVRALYGALFDRSAVAARVEQGWRWAARFDWQTTWSDIKRMACAVKPLEDGLQ